MTAGRTVVVGDVHGCREELEELLWKIGVGKADRVVFVGDVVARGPDSRGVLALIRALGATLVRGNHEEKLLRHRAEWEKLGAVHEKVARALSEDDWEMLEASVLRVDLPDNGVRVVHAGVAPGVAIEHQTRETLLTVRTLDRAGAPSDKPGRAAWGARYDGPPHVVFGHWAQRDVQIHPWATGLDTGCVYGGRLTAMVLLRGEKPPDVAHRREVLVSVPAHRAWFGGGLAVQRKIPLGPIGFLPRRGFVVVPVMPPHKLPDGTTARSALVGFAEGRYVAYANVCRHLAIALDYGDGDVMDDEGTHLLCHHHGAMFEPGHGECILGPCFGEWLWRWEVEVDGAEAMLVIGGEREATPKGPFDDLAEEV